MGLPDVFKLIDSAISKRQGDQTKHRERHLMDRAMKQSTHQFHKNIFSYLKMFSMQCRKIITVEDNKKRMNITNFIDIYIQIYIPMLYMTKMTQNKNDSINSCY